MPMDPTIYLGPRPGYSSSDDVIDDEAKARRICAAASLRRWTPSLSSRLWTWFFTVASSMESRAAICLFEQP